jgi:hypothetical protein
MAGHKGQQVGDDGVRLRRRGFIGAGLAGAGVALVGATRTARAQAPVAGGPVGRLPQPGYPHLPAIPVDDAGLPDTLQKLEIRAAQTQQAKQALTERFTLAGQRHDGYTFLYGAQPPRPLEHPDQFAIGWTTMPDVARAGAGRLARWSSTLSDPDAATREFWPTIARYGIALNIVGPQRVTSAMAGELRRAFGSAWTRPVQAAADAGQLYVFDMRRFEALAPQTTSDGVRFTPATATLLRRSARSGELRPVAVLVSGPGGAGRQVYTREHATDGAWLYALQAAKTSITVFGIWLGHVYQWHLVTAAMLMTMRNTLASGHPIRQMLAPQSKYLIAFDQALLLQWSSIAPPTSLTTSDQFLALCNAFADGRRFFDDDPAVTLRQMGLRERDFSDREPWDRFPVARKMLTVHRLVERYVGACVEAAYASDAAVAGDEALQAWMAASGAPDAGNVQGLPALTSRAALTAVCTSLLHRITVHGASRLVSTPNPALSFVSNFPHCLQRTDIPGPRSPIDTQTLLSYLPNTKTIGQALGFYFIFAFSTPYEPAIPLGGPGADLFYPGGPDSPRNRALIDFRKGLAGLIRDWQPDVPQLYQWPRNIET